jgi:hypothetical protein
VGDALECKVRYIRWIRACASVLYRDWMYPIVHTFFGETDTRTAYCVLRADTGTLTLKASGQGGSEVKSKSCEGCKGDAAKDLWMLIMVRRQVSKAYTITQSALTPPLR